MCTRKNCHNAYRCDSSRGDYRRAADQARYQSQQVMETLKETGHVERKVSGAPAPAPATLDEVREAVEALREARETLSETDFYLTAGSPELTGEARVLDGIARREEQIRAVGSLVASYADAKAGVDVVQAADDYEEMLDAARKDLDESDAAVSKANRERNALAVRLCAEAGQSIPPHVAVTEAGKLKLSDADTKRWEKATQALEEAKQTATARRANLKAIEQGDDNITMMNKLRLISAYKDALKEVREYGGVALKADGIGVEAVAKTIAANYPREWIEQSNASNSLKIILNPTSSTIAHYIHEDRGGKIEATVPMSVQKPAGWEPDPANPLHEGWSVDEKATQKLGQAGKRVWTGPKTEVFGSSPAHRVDMKTGEPQGPGWRKAVIDGKEKWVRPMRVMVRDNTSHAVLRTSPPNNRDMDWASTAIHEFGHRAEYIRPHLSTMEQRFVERRTTTAGMRDAQVTLREADGKRFAGPQGDALVRPDNFISPYMGREYEHGTREIYTTGMEALFLGKYGGLIGLDASKTRDYEMRDLVLGINATL